MHRLATATTLMLLLACLLLPSTATAYRWEYYATVTDDEGRSQFIAKNEKGRKFAFDVIEGRRDWEEGEIILVVEGDCVSCPYIISQDVPRKRAHVMLGEASAFSFF